MAKYKVVISTEFVQEIEVEAENAQDAADIVRNRGELVKEDGWRNNGLDYEFCEAEDLETGEVTDLRRY